MIGPFITFFKDDLAQENSVQIHFMDYKRSEVKLNTEVFTF